jgi:hypothetical protein
VNKMRRLLFATIATVASTVHASESIPVAGCYERVYDPPHLTAHKGQIIDHVWAVVEPKADGVSMPYGINLKFSVKGYTKSTFETSGACEADGGGIICNASLSAEERGLCKRKGDGVRSCRIDYGESGRFRASSDGDSLRITVVERLELDTDKDQGDYLYLSPSNKENHEFLLKSASASVCKWN